MKPREVCYELVGAASNRVQWHIGRDNEENFEYAPKRITLSDLYFRIYILVDFKNMVLKKYSGLRVWN